VEEVTNRAWSAETSVYPHEVPERKNTTRIQPASNAATIRILIFWSSESFITSIKIETFDARSKTEISITEQ